MACRECIKLHVVWTAASPRCLLKPIILYGSRLCLCRLRHSPISLCITQARQTAATCSVCPIHGALFSLLILISSCRNNAAKSYLRRFRLHDLRLFSFSSSSLFAASSQRLGFAPGRRRRPGCPSPTSSSSSSLAASFARLSLRVSFSEIHSSFISFFRRGHFCSVSKVNWAFLPSRGRGEWRMAAYFTLPHSRSFENRVQIQDVEARPKSFLFHQQGNLHFKLMSSRQKKF